MNWFDLDAVDWNGMDVTLAIAVTVNWFTPLSINQNLIKIPFNQFHHANLHLLSLIFQFILPNTPRKSNKHKNFFNNKKKKRLEKFLQDDIFLKKTQKRSNEEEEESWKKHSLRFVIFLMTLRLFLTFNFLILILILYYCYVAICVLLNMYILYVIICWY